MSEKARHVGGTPRTGQPQKQVLVPGAAAHDATCPIAGIGASAGGLEAFTRLLRALPEGIGIALVLVQHLDPMQESMLAELLRHHSRIPVVEAADGMRVESGHAYVMPAGVTMILRDGVLVLSSRPKLPVKVLPVDTLLRSMADECGDRAIGIVLSGTGSDGVMGLSAIKEAGGLVFVQDPDSAEYEGMPRASIDAGVADRVLDPEGLAAELARIAAEPRLTGLTLPDPESPRDVDEQSMREVLSILREATGLDFSQYRRTSLLRRISRRMLLTGVPTMEEYVGRLHEQPAEVELLYRDVLVNMTEFFRDPAALDALKRTVFPEILARKQTHDAIRVWVPGCSRGQEAYSILMTLVEFLEGQEVRPEIQVFASDVNGQDIDFARAGVYPEGIANEVSPERLARFFVQVPGGFRVDRAIREMCVFAVHDVTSDPPFSKLDLVSFRNVLIYMERPLQKRVLQILHYSLVPGGFLLLGSSETAGADSALFSAVDTKYRIYKRKPGAGKLAALAPSNRGMKFAKEEAVAEGVPTFDVLAEADKIVRAGYQPAGLLVSENLDVLQFRGHVGPYLDPAEGPPELKLPRLVGPGLSSAGEAAIKEAADTKAVAKRSWTSGTDGRHRRTVEVEAVPITSPSGDTYYLVVFKERSKEGGRPKARGKQSEEPLPASVEDSVMRRELDETRQQLEVVVAEREAANSELRATAERFQSSNEELRTINEEFQTAQEELQSTNEELTTLNDELRGRNNELGILADDLNNVIEGVEIPILILDSDLRIRRFTPQSGDIVSITATDVGRPITDLSLNIDVPDFKDKVRAVLQEGKPSQTETQRRDGHWYSMRIRPYMTGGGSTAGVVVAFIDIDQLKKAAEITEAAREHAEGVVETVREPLLTLDADLAVQEANDAFYQTFSVSPEETIGRAIYELGDRQWGFPELRSLLEKVLPGDEGFANLVVERDFPRIGHRVMQLYAQRVREEHGQPSILLVVNDITEASRRQRLGEVLNNVSIEIVSSLEFDDVLESVLGESADALRASSATLLVQQNGKWVMKNAYGLPRALIERVFDEQVLPKGVTARAAAAPVILGPAEVKGFMSELGIEPSQTSLLVIPLLARDERIGFISFHFQTAERVFGEAEMDFARRLGTLISLAFENAKLYAVQREIAETLQAALLTTPERIEGLEFGYLYRSATAAAAVGGDFFDIFELEGGRAGVLLGDVSGKGVQAATLTALVKNTIRALAYENDSPAVVMKKANAVIFKATSPALFVTITFSILDIASGSLVHCSAGHTRGIVRRREGGVEMLDVGSPLAGAFDWAEFTDGETTLEQGDALILYTDGVTEARSDGELYGEQRLADFVAGMPVMKPRNVPEAIFDEVMRYTGGTLSDDVAIIAVGRSEG